MCQSNILLTLALKLLKVIKFNLPFDLFQSEICLLELLNFAMTFVQSILSDSFE